MNFTTENRNYIYYNGGRHPIGNISEHIRVRAIPGFRNEVIRATNRATELAADYARDNAPVQSGNLVSHIHADIDKSGTFHPGGLGGGGNWTSNVYVDTLGGRAPYALYLLYGTGIYGEKKTNIRYGKQVSFFWFKRGVKYSAWEIQGTPIDRSWWDGAIRTFEYEIGRRIYRIRSLGVSPGIF